MGWCVKTGWRLGCVCCVWFSCWPWRSWNRMSVSVKSVRTDTQVLRQKPKLLEKALTSNNFENKREKSTVLS